MDRSGQEVWPAIALARRILDVLGDEDISVSAEKVSSRENQASQLSRSEIQYRRAGGWRSDEDRWLYHPAFKSVFQWVARNCSYPMLDLLPFYISGEVLRVCGEFFLVVGAEMYARC